MLYFFIMMAAVIIAVCIMVWASKPLTEFVGKHPTVVVLCLSFLLMIGLSLIAAHTNWDAAPGGSNDALMQAAGFDRGVTGEGFLRTVDVDLMPDALVEQLSGRLRTQALFFGDRSRPVRRIACCSGSGGSELGAAAAAGADCFLTGEMKHHELLEAMQLGVRVALVGHGRSEEPAADALNRALQSGLDALQYSVRVVRSKVDPFA